MAEPITKVLGIVSIKPRGEYNSEATYEKLNTVTYQGATYCAKTSTQGHLPTDTNFWNLMVEKGEKGDTPVKGVDYYTSSDKQELIDELESTLDSDVTDEVTEQLGRLVSATPLVASSVSGMTDTSRIYVNTTDTHWYWYDGTNWQDGGIYQATGISDLDPEIVKLKNYHNDTINLFEITGEGIIEKTYSNEDWGIINTSDQIAGAGYHNSMHTDYIPIVPIVGAVISSKARGITNCSVITLYDIDKEVITRVVGLYPNAYTLDTYELTINSSHKNARYVRFSSYTGNHSPLDISYSIKYNNVPEQIEDLIDKKIGLVNFSLLDTFLSIGVAGDSLSVGWMQKQDQTNSNRNIKYSWPQYLARNHGITVKNFGESGVNCKQWITTGSCYPEAALPANKVQCYIIGLGVNDNSNQYTGGWGSLSDIKQDYHDNEDSFYGYYGGIIQRLKELNSDCIIFCLSIPGARQSDGKNTIIEDIATHFGEVNNVHFIDLTEYNNIFNDSKMQEFYVGGHYEAAGYNICSQIINRAISKYMLNNSQYFKYIGFIPYAE